MPDLNTESNYVQGIIHKYIQELKDIGVAGVRWDAAKHIGECSGNLAYHIHYAIYSYYSPYLH